MPHGISQLEFAKVEYPQVKRKIEQLEKQVVAYQEGLACLEGYLSQLPGTGILQQMIKVWFADAQPES